MSGSPFDNPILSGLFGDPEVSRLLGAEAELEQAARFEAALASAEASVGFIPADAARAIGETCAGFRPDMDTLRETTAQDGVMGPGYVEQLRAAVAEPYRSYVHKGATSQDIVDTALVVRLRSIASIFDARLAGLIDDLDNLAGRFGQHRLMGRTRMQDALEIAVSDRLADWRLPLERARERLAQLAGRVFVVQLGGGVGNGRSFGPRSSEIVSLVAQELGLAPGGKAWHTQRDGMLEFASWLAAISGSLGKMGQDAALMALAGSEQIELAGGGGSSAMPHKSNPVAAEALISLARYNAVQLGGMGQAMVHEQERSGAAWGLEWLVLPQMAMATGAGLLLARRLLSSIRSVGSAS